MSKYKNPTCRGAWALGTACGRCERCIETRPGKMTTPDPLLPELIAELNAPSREDLIRAVRYLAGFTAGFHSGDSADTIKYCMENGK